MQNIFRVFSYKLKLYIFRKRNGIHIGYTMFCRNEKATSHYPFSRVPFLCGLKLQVYWKTKTRYILLWGLLINCVKAKKNLQFISQNMYRRRRKWNKFFVLGSVVGWCMKYGTEELFEKKSNVQNVVCVRKFRSTIKIYLNTTTTDVNVLLEITLRFMWIAPFVPFTPNCCS